MENIWRISSQLRVMRFQSFFEGEIQPQKAKAQKENTDEKNIGIFQKMFKLCKSSIWKWIDFAKYWCRHWSGSSSNAFSGWNGYYRRQVYDGRRLGPNTTTTEVVNNDFKQKKTSVMRAFLLFNFPKTR